MTDAVSQYGYLAVLVLVGLESLGIPLPGETTLIAAAIYAGATHRLSIALVVAAAALGAVLGDNLGYLLGHWGGYPLLVRYGRYIRLDERKLKVARYVFDRYGAYVVFFGRFVSILRTYAAFLAGTARMRWPRFLAFNAAGGIVWAALYGIGAYLLGHEIERLSRSLTVVLAGVAVVAVAAGVWLLRRSFGELEARAEQAYPGPLDSPRKPRFSAL